MWSFLLYTLQVFSVILSNNPCHQGPELPLHFRRIIAFFRYHYQLATMRSGSSTADSHVYPADMEESNFLKRSRTLHWTHLGLSLLTSAGAVAIVACEAVPYRHYKNTAHWASSGLALWPLNFDLRPTFAALSCGCVIAFLNLIYVVVALLPSVSLFHFHTPLYLP